MDHIIRPPAASVACVGLRKSYEAEVDGHRWRHAVLRDVSLAVRASRCTAIVGAGLGPVTVIRCLAGLVVPERGSIIWRDESGRCVAPPLRAMVTAGWRPYACHTVRDVLEQAVPAGLAQAAADARVAAAAQRCGLLPALGRRATALPAAAVRLVATAAAVVAGVHWIFLDRREAIDSVEAADDASDGRHAGPGPAPKPTGDGATRLERRALRRLVQDGYTVIAAGPAPHCASLAPAVRVALASGRLERYPGAEAARRVAERDPVPDAVGAGRRTDGAAMTGVVGPVATVSGPP